MESFIILHRKLTQWEWFDDSKMVHLFLYFLLQANWEEKNWRGINIKRGQFVTGSNRIKKDTSMSLRSIRTCIEKLKSTGEVTVQTTNRFSLVTIAKYDDYQTNNIKATSKPSQTRQTNDKQTTTTNNNNLSLIHI